MLSVLYLKTVPQLAFNYAVSKNIKHTISWESNWCADANWFHPFLKKNERLSLRKAEATSLARSSSFNKKMLSSFLIT